MFPVVCRMALHGAPLTESDRATDRVIAKRRCRVGHVFGFIEGAMDWSVFRGVGLAWAKAACALTRLTYNLHRFARLLQTWPALSPVAATLGVGRRRAGKGETLIFSLLVTGSGIYRTCLNCQRTDSIRTRIET